MRLRQILRLTLDGKPAPGILSATTRVTSYGHPATCRAGVGRRRADCGQRIRTRFNDELNLIKRAATTAGHK